MNFNGQTLAEKHQDGTWSDYIYANGQKIARADNYDVRIHFSGTNCSNNCGPQAWSYDIPIQPYVIQSGDKIAWRQYQEGPAVPRGGLAIEFTDGTSTNWTTQDQNGQVMNNDSTQNAWDYRIADLSAFAGKTISVAWINEDTASGAGNWQEWFSDISFYRTDGTVDPIYHRQTNVSYPAWGYPGVTNQQFEINVSPDTQYANDTTYYVGDQTGSVREEFGGEGWPVSSSVFYPFGVEQTATTDPNSYKFATLERDSESNLDHATFRQYTPLAGRWMSPDPYNGSYDLNNPQSFNRYAYALNNPMSLVDPLGLNPICINFTTTSETSTTIFYETDGDYWFGGTDTTDTVTTSQSCSDPTGGGNQANPSTGNLPGAGSSSGSGGGGGGNPSSTNDSMLHKIACFLAGPLLDDASTTNATVGLGAGGSAGGGALIGVGVSGGVQIVADPKGNVGLSFTFSGIFPGPIVGYGAMIGGQVSVSTAKSIYDLGGDSLDTSISVGSGPAVGIDVSHNPQGGPVTATATIGPGVGTKGAALMASGTAVPSLTSVKCR